MTLYRFVNNPPAPTVTAISPNKGPTTGGTSVTITGTGFINGAAVSFGDTAARSVTYVSSTRLTATTNAHDVEFVDITVTNPGNQPGSLRPDDCDAIPRHEWPESCEVGFRYYAVNVEFTETITDQIYGTLPNLAVGDFNGDGLDDAVVAKQWPSNPTNYWQLQLFTSNGAGGFTETITGQIYGTLPNLAVGDFNKGGWGQLLKLDKIDQGPENVP